MKLSRKLLFLTAFAVAGLAHAAATVADTLVDATFTDGASLTGSFGLDSYGYLGAVDITTTSSGIFTGYDYTLGSIVPNSPPADGISLINSDYSRSLYLVFEQPLNQPGIDFINTSASWECMAYSCASGSADIRYLASGYASPAPLPNTFVLFALGLFSMAGRLRAIKS